MKFIQPVFLCVIWLMPNPALWANTPKLFKNITKETPAYAVKNGQTLYLDIYRAKSNKQKQSPCILFLFGGSFKGGTRNSDSYLFYFDYLARQGYTVVSADYRLGLKDIKPKKTAEIVKAVKNAVDIAVQDAYSATAYLLTHAKDHRIDPNQIIISGSSAGAITALQAEYENCNQTHQPSPLPPNFRYAGVISFAGGILITDTTNLQWKNKPAPILLFHGDADATVPFEKIKLGNASFYGSNHIATQLRQIESPHCLYCFEGSAHEISSRPMKNNQAEIQRFLNTIVQEHQQLMINTHLREIGKETSDKPIPVEQFIKNNFSK